MTSESEDQIQRRGRTAASSAPPKSPVDGADLPTHWLLVARPHLQLRGDALYSLGVPERFRRLTEAEVELWNLTQRSASVQEALQSCGPGADRLIRTFLREGLCELVEPAFPANRRRVLIVEPHADDAILSVGGTLWLRRHECNFVIATVASRSNHTRYRELGGEHDINTVTEIRRREADLAARMLGGEHVAVGLTDAALRYHDTEWTADFYRRHRMSISASISRTADEAELRCWMAALQRLVTEQQPTEIWFPLGGPHADHMLTADACLAVFADSPSLVRDRILRIYQEVPYAVRFPRHMSAALAAVRGSGAVLDEEVTSIAQVLAEKRRLASVYASQDMDELFAAGGDRPEVFWRVRDLPRQGAAAGTVARAIVGPEPEVRTTAAWVARNRNAALVRVLLTTPTGRWQADLNLLRTAFPRARFEVCTASVAEAEVAEVISDRVDARTVAGGTSAWLVETLRLCLLRPAPTLVHAAQQRLRPVRLLSRLWLGSDALTVTSMDQLASALRIAPGEH
jgi:LmbE family N-acetylglucosaminyl deacetylase